MISCRNLSASDNISAGLLNRRELEWKIDRRTRTANIVALAGGLNSSIGREAKPKISTGAAAVALLGKFVSMVGGDMFNGLWEMASVSKTIEAAGGVVDCDNICSKPGDREGVPISP